MFEDAVQVSEASDDEAIGLENGNTSKPLTSNWNDSAIFLRNNSTAISGSTSDPSSPPWRTRSIRDSVRNAIQLAHDKGFQSIAFPLIGAGSGGFNQEQAKKLMLDELSKLEVPMLVKIVVFRKAKA